MNNLIKHKRDFRLNRTVCLFHIIFNVQIAVFVFLRGKTRNVDPFSGCYIATVNENV